MNTVDKVTKEELDALLLDAKKDVKQLNRFDSSLGRGIVEDVTSLSESITLLTRYTTVVQDTLAKARALQKLGLL